MKDKSKMKNKFKKKLKINRRTVSNLTPAEMTNSKGGASHIDPACYVTEGSMCSQCYTCPVGCVPIEKNGG